MSELAAEEGVTAPYGFRLPRLTCLAPEIVMAILDGRQLKGSALADLLREVPLAWSEQQETFRRYSAQKEDIGIPPRGDVRSSFDTPIDFSTWGNRQCLRIDVAHNRPSSYQLHQHRHGCVAGSIEGVEFGFLVILQQHAGIDPFKFDLTHGPAAKMPLFDFLVLAMALAGRTVVPGGLVHHRGWRASVYALIQAGARWRAPALQKSDLRIGEIKECPIAQDRSPSPPC